MKKTKNIIFDLGGVLLNIDYNITIQEFKKLGVKNFDKIFSQFNQDAIARQFEMGLITDEGFRHYIKKHSGINLKNEDIDRAWNAMLLDFPRPRITMLQELKKDYNIFLLSNTNSIHFDAFQRTLNEMINPIAFDSLFHKAYYSHIMGMRKPDEEIFEKVLDDSGLDRQETLFIDDNRFNIESARSIGLKVYDFEIGDEITALIKDSLL